MNKKSILLAVWLTAVATFGIRNCELVSAVKQKVNTVKQERKEAADKKFVNIESTKKAEEFFEAYEGFNVKGNYRGRTCRFEVNRSFNMAIRYSPRDHNYDKEHYIQTTSWAECVMYDYNNDLRPDRLDFTIRNSDNEVYTEGTNQNTLIKMANKLGETTFVAYRSNLDEFSKQEMKKIFRDSEKEMKGIYNKLGVRSKLRKYRSPFRR